MRAKRLLSKSSHWAAFVFGAIVFISSTTLATVVTPTINVGALPRAGSATATLDIQVATPAVTGSTSGPIQSTTQGISLGQATPSATTVDWYARTFGLIGLALGVANLAFALWKLRRDRKLSVEDDFWFRKIVTPAAIEPMLKTFVELASNLPDEKTPESERKTYAVKVTTEFAKLYASMGMLAMFDTNLPTAVREHLSKAEDILSDHSAGLAAVSPTCNYAETTDKLWTILNTLLNDIKRWHRRF